MKDVLKAIDDRMKRIDRNLQSAPESAHEFIKGDRVFLSALKTLIERRASELSENKSEKIPEAAHAGGCLSDWKCAACGKANPAFTSVCEHCNAYRFMNAQLSDLPAAPEPPKPQVGFADWRCSKCGMYNRVSRVSCGCCDTRKPEPPPTIPEPQKPGTTAFPLHGWICPVCGRGNSPTSDRCECKDEPTGSFFDHAMSPV